MAKVPEYQQMIREPSPETPRTNLQATPAEFGAQRAQAIEGLGRSVEAFGKDMFQMQNELDKTSAQKQVLGAKDELSAENARFRTLQGEDAANDLQNHQQAIQQINDKYRGALNGHSSMLYDHMMTEQIVSDRDSSVLHAASEMRRFSVALKAGLVQQSLNDADNPKLSEHDIQVREDQLKANIYDYNKSQGLPPELGVDASVKELWTRRVKAQTASGNYDSAKASIATMQSRNMGGTAELEEHVEQAKIRKQHELDAEQNKKRKEAQDAVDGKLISALGSGDPKQIDLVLPLLYDAEAKGVYDEKQTSTWENRLNSRADKLSKIYSEGEDKTALSDSQQYRYKLEMMFANGKDSAGNPINERDMLGAIGAFIDKSHPKDTQEWINFAGRVQSSIKREEKTIHNYARKTGVDWINERESSNTFGNLELVQDPITKEWKDLTKKKETDWLGTILAGSKTDQEKERMVFSFGVFRENQKAAREWMFGTLTNILNDPKLNTMNTIEAKTYVKDALNDELHNYTMQSIIKRTVNGRTLYRQMAEASKKQAADEAMPPGFIQRVSALFDKEKNEKYLSDAEKEEAQKEKILKEEPE